MTITLPWRGTGSRRAVDKLATLERQLAAVQTDNAQLLAHRDAALAHIEDLRDRHAQTYKAWEEEAQLRGEAEMAAALTQSQLEDAQADIDRLETEVRALRAQIANLTAVTVPPWQRDVDPDDHPTEPAGIDVKPLWEALRQHGPVIPMTVPTAGTSPAHIPTWTPSDSAVRLPGIRLAKGAA